MGCPIHHSIFFSFFIVHFVFAIYREILPAILYVHRLEFPHNLGNHPRLLPQQIHTHTHTHTHTQPKSNRSRILWWNFMCLYVFVFFPQNKIFERNIIMWYDNVSLHVSDAHSASMRVWNVKMRASIIISSSSSVASRRMLDASPRGESFVNKTRQLIFHAIESTKRSSPIMKTDKEGKCFLAFLITEKWPVTTDQRTRSYTSSREKARKPSKASSSVGRSFWLLRVAV